MLKKIAEKSSQARRKVAQASAPQSGPAAGASKEETRFDFVAGEMARVDGEKPGASPGQTDSAATVKHRRMAGSPFRFFRGSASLFYKDLSAGNMAVPEALLSLPLTRIMGDCHFSNFGFLTEEGSHGDKLVWTPNDFDDACVGHAAWDLLRYAVSLFLVADYCNGVVDGLYHSDAVESGDMGEAPSQKAAANAVIAFLDSYRAACHAMAEDPDWRDRVTSDFDKDHFLHRHWKKAKRRMVGGDSYESRSSLGKETLCFEGEMRFRDRPERFEKLDGAEANAVRDAFRPYVDDEILDVVLRKGAGTGSLDMARYYLLVGPANREIPDWERVAHIVEVKRQREAAPIFHFPSLSPVNRMNPAHLTVDCQRLMQRRADLVLDEAFWRDQSWLVRSRHHARVGLDPEHVLKSKKPGKALRQYAEACGTVLAQAHARGDRRSSHFEAMMAETLPYEANALRDVARQYAEQVKEDQIMLSLKLPEAAEQE